ERLLTYWPGRSFDTFDAREWSGSGRERAARAAVTLVKVPHRDATLQQIELLPSYASRTLIALDRPTSFSGGTALGGVGAQRTGLVEVAGEEVHFSAAANAYKYDALSLPV